MNLYFAAAIRAGRELQPVYAALVRALQAAGHAVLTEHVASGTIFADEAGQTDAQIFAQDIAYLDRVDALVAEVTIPSLGVGYEIAYALHVRNIPVVCLYRQETSLSAMLTGNPHPRLTLLPYADLPGALAALDGFLKRLG